MRCYPQAVATVLSQVVYLVVADTVIRIIGTHLKAVSRLWTQTQQTVFLRAQPECTVGSQVSAIHGSSEGNPLRMYASVATEPS